MGIIKDRINNLREVNEKLYIQIHENNNEIKKLRENCRHSIIIKNGLRFCTECESFLQSAK